MTAALTGCMLLATWHLTKPSGIVFNMTSNNSLEVADGSEGGSIARSTMKHDNMIQQSHVIKAQLDCNTSVPNGT